MAQVNGSAKPSGIVLDARRPDRQRVTRRKQHHEEETSRRAGSRDPPAQNPRSMFAVRFDTLFIRSATAYCRMHYRRIYEGGGCYFFTVVTAGRRPVFASSDAVAALRHAFAKVRDQHPFDIEAAVVLPDHLHCIWTLPASDADFSRRWRLIKSDVSKRLPAQQPVWQPRFWEHLIRDDTDLKHHIDYIHFNPVKHRVSDAPAAWPYSSVHRYIAAGVYPPDWGQATEPAIPDGIGRE